MIFTFEFLLKKFLFISFCFFLISKITVADSLSISPSFYFTFGNYTNQNKSYSYSFYNSTQLSRRFFLINHYDNLKISKQGWNYKQQAFLLGSFYNYFPYFLKLNYIHFKGDYTAGSSPFYKSSDYNYSDFTNLYNIDLIYYQNLFYYGISYSHINSIGILTSDSLNNQVVNQFTLRYEYIFSPELFLSIKPSISLLKDGRKLFSISTKAHYLLFQNFTLKIGGFFGKRAYYFDSDLLTIFNQNDTQNFLVYGQIDYFLFNSILFTLAYQNTNFDNYSINYYTAGIKTYLNF